MISPNSQKRPLSAQHGHPYQKLSDASVNALAASGQTSPQPSSRPREYEYEFPGDRGYMKYRGVSSGN